MSEKREYEGIVNVLKPPGMTSSDAVADIRKVFSMKRVGHTGTLDPGAAGVLPICLGRATRLFDFLVDKKKEYIAEIAFGAATDTEDSYGQVTARSCSMPDAETLKAVFPRFTGEIVQIAPMYSAVRVDGKKLYQLARSGADKVERQRKATVDSMEYIAQTGMGRHLFRMVCSRGTYVRTVCKDMGEALGAQAHMSFLLRTRSGDFTIENALSIAELAEMRDAGRLFEAVTPMEKAVSFLPEVRMDSLSARKMRLLMNGAEIECPKPCGTEENTPLRVYAEGAFVGLGRCAGDMLHIDLYLSDTGEEQ